MCVLPAGTIKSGKHSRLMKESVDDLLFLKKRNLHRVASMVSICGCQPRTGDPLRKNISYALEAATAH